MTRSEGERVRALHTVARLRAAIDAVEIALHCDGPPGFDVTQPVTEAAVTLATTIARLDAYRRAEDDTTARDARREE